MMAACGDEKQYPRQEEKTASQHGGTEKVWSGQKEEKVQSLVGHTPVTVKQWEISGELEPEGRGALVPSLRVHVWHDCPW